MKSEKKFSFQITRGDNHAKVVFQTSYSFTCDEQSLVQNPFAL